MFSRERHRLMLYRTNRESFAQVIGEHAVHLVELAQANADNAKKPLMSKWVDIHKINNEWAGLVTRNDHPDSEFAQVATRLVHLYSETLADYILDRELVGLNELVATERKFFDALGAVCSSGEWVAYTSSVLSMVDALQRYGKDSQSFESVAGQCVRNGILLGSHLDVSMYKTDRRK